MQTQRNLATFLHQCCLCPPKCPWIAAIKRNFSLLGPGLPSNLSKNTYLIKRRRQRAICANLEKKSRSNKTKAPASSAFSATQPTLIPNDTDYLTAPLPPVVPQSEHTSGTTTVYPTAPSPPVVPQSKRTRDHPYNHHPAKFFIHRSG